MNTHTKEFLEAQRKYLTASDWKLVEATTGTFGGKPKNRKFDFWMHPKTKEMYTEPAAVSCQLQADGYLQRPKL